MVKTSFGSAALIVLLVAGVCHAGAEIPCGSAPTSKAMPEDCRRALRRTAEQVFQRRRDEIKHYDPQRGFRTYQELIQDARCPISNKPYVISDEADGSYKAHHTIRLTCPDAKQHVAAQAGASNEAEYAVKLAEEWRCPF